MTDYTSKHLPALTLLLAGLLLFAALPLQAGVVARLSSRTTSLEQTVRLTLETQGGEDSAPDLTPLEADFEIVGRATQQSVSIINGTLSSKRSLILTLLPRRSGKLTIPPIPFGDQKTAPLTLEVSEQPSDQADAAQSQQAWVELSLNKQEAFPEEEVILSLKLYQAAGVRGEYLDQPQPSLGDTRLQLLDESSSTIERDGQAYRVLERSYGLYAYQTGSLEIAPVEYRGRSGGVSIFSLLDDPFGTPAQGGSRLVRAKSNRVSLRIKPVPDDFTGDHWLPARSIQLVETGIDDSAPLQAGKPLTRRIMLIADGLISSQLPALVPPVPDEIKTYEERPQLHDTPRRTGISSSRESVVTLIPTRAGHFTLPAVEIPWWNTETGRQEIARLPAVNLEVLQGATPATADTPPVAQAQPKSESSAAELADEPASPSPIDREQGGLHWLVWALGAAWLATLAGWWLSHRRRKPADPASAPPADSSPQTSAPDGDLAVEALIAAYRESDAAAAREAWLRWGQSRWPEQPPNNLTRLAVRCPQPVAEAVTRLEKAFYSPAEEAAWSSGFDPASLRQQVEPEAPSPSVDDRLLPLNP